jgi:hypothetical protein
MSTALPVQSTALSTPARTAVAVVAAVVAAALVNTVIALVVGALNDAPVEMGLSFAEYGSATLVGVLVGTAGWAMIRRRSVLRIAVPVALVVSFVPDCLILLGGATLLNVVGLMLMHIVVAAATVAALSRALPAR